MLINNLENKNMSNELLENLNQLKKMFVLLSEERKVGDVSP
jgi:hypothetical protein